MSTQLLPACRQNESELLKPQLQPEHEFLSLQEYQEKKKKVTRATSSCYCLYLYFWINFFSPWRFWFHRFCLGLIGLAFFYCSPSSHFVFSILSLEAMSRPAVGTPLSPIGPTAALSLQLTLRPLNISMFQVGSGTVCVLVSCHSVECSLCNFCLVSIVSRCLPWGAPTGFGTAPGLAERGSALRNGGGVSLWFLPILLVRCFTVRMPWFSGSVDGHELDMSYVGLDFSCSCTSWVPA